MSAGYYVQFMLNNGKPVASSIPATEHSVMTAHKTEKVRKYYIYMLNGEGAGRYEVTWVIQDKHYLRRVVDWNF